MAIIDLKPIDFFSINRQRSIITIAKIKQNLTFALLNVILNLNSGSSMLQLVSSVGPSLNTKKLRLYLSICTDEILKKITYLVKSSTKLYEPTPLNSNP